MLIPFVGCFSIIMVTDFQYIYCPTRLRLFLYSFGARIVHLEMRWSIVSVLIITIIIIIIIIIIVIIIELAHSKTILENTVEIEPQPVALDFRSLSIF